MTRDIIHSQAGDPTPSFTPSSERVTYLLGAGATEGSTRFSGSTKSLLMPGLAETLSRRIHERYHETFSGSEGIGRLVNEVIDDSPDLEQLITFLVDTPSALYKQFSDELKRIFSSVLRSLLDDIRADHGPYHSQLYAALLDMHAVPGLTETLLGFITLNYDAFLEHAIEERLNLSVDYGINPRPQSPPSEDSHIPVLKLHGSFGWSHTWPIHVVSEDDPGLWIAPGIRKEKRDYPFNVIWGAARELLDCDVLRIIGCNLGPNDWDLVSLLFTTLYGRGPTPPYRIELIDWPKAALSLTENFPYLNVQSLLEIQGIGPQLVSEVLGGSPTDFLGLTQDERQRALANANDKISNPFEHWLRLKGELMLQDLPSIETSDRIFEPFLESGA